MAFYLLEQMAEFTPTLVQSATSLLPLFATALAETTPAQTRMAAVRAVMSVIVNTPDEQQAMPLQSLAPAMLAAICLPLQSKV